MTPRIQVFRATELGSLPDSAEAWVQQLGRATFIRVSGRDRSRTRIVATLLHGNEPSGIRAVHAWLRAGVEPATNAAFYIGSVEAALASPAWSHRSLPDARDANRSFAPPFSDAEGERARELLALIEAVPLEALVDVHNNSGLSPAYGVGTRSGAEHMALTALFADRYVLSDLRLDTLIEATEPLVPSVVIECGRAGDAVADAVALAGLERYLAAGELCPRGERSVAMEVLHRPIRVRLQPEVRLAFGAAPVVGADFTIRADVDRHNFGSVEPGTVLGWLGPSRVWPFDARGGDGVEVSAALFASEDGIVRTRCAMIPIMMTLSVDIARSDCLFYAVQKR